MTKDCKEFAISPAPPHLMRDALSLVLAEVPTERREAQVERLLASARSGEFDLSGLLVARREGILEGALWARIQAGRSATVWPPVAARPQYADCTALLALAAIEWLHARDIRLAQALVAIDTNWQASPLATVGFEPVAELLYMVCLVDRPPVTAAAEAEIDFEPIAARHSDRIASLIEETYQDTLDCPGLNGVREIGDVLDGYRSCPAGAAAQWFIARRAGHDVGCLLLIDEPADAQCEIIYAGLVPAARGRGLGRTLVHRAQQEAHRAGRARLVLAVDRANLPAVKTYAGTGFQTWDQRRALVRIFPKGGTAP